MSKEEFEAIAAKIKANGKDAGIEEKQALKLYGLYKQALLGDNTTEKPSFYQLEAKAKWNAWGQKKGVSQESAQQQYIELAKTLLKE